MRVPHTTRCQFFRDDPTECEVIWYPVNPDAPNLEFPSMVTNSYLDPDGVFFLPGGEVYGADRPFNHELPKPGALGGHYCGTPADFANGCAVDLFAPGVTYRTDGLPSCCGAAAAARGGGAGGGRDLVSVVAAGGLTCLTAGTLPPGAVAHGAVPDIGQLWWTFPVTAGDNVNFTVTLPVGQIRVNVLRGADCGTAVPVEVRFPTAPGDSWTNAAPATESFFVQVLHVHAQPDPTNFTLSYTLS